ncbi:uncharacterized protein LOC105638366 isoform X2 [Jatropha curcas]|uniref:uncharacterized protein LOC105638366 isoform X2 n=1 Tax=Jatropha curcas TaxID=180498 RepID=UPI0005FAD556|nr:uncharacterized protein LOC105638366 isoform X2 [Jatropha curcas]
MIESYTFTCFLIDSEKRIATVMEESSVAIKQNPATGADIEFARCECCGLIEECTVAYVVGVRKRYGGKWICGLCGEATQDEVNRSENNLGSEGALELHMKFCQQFKSSTPPTNPTGDLISALRKLLRRTLDTPKRKKASLVFPSD